MKRILSSLSKIPNSKIVFFFLVFFIIAFAYAKQNPSGNQKNANQSTQKNGSFYISQKIDNDWITMFKQSFGVTYETHTFTLTPHRGKVILSFNQKNVSYGDIEYIQLKACDVVVKPDYAHFVKSHEDVAEDILKDDNNVIAVHEDPIEVSWTIQPNCDKKVEVFLKANEYESPEKYAFRFPDYDIPYSTYPFKNNGALVVDGKLKEVDDIVRPDHSPFWFSMTGHPSNNVHVYLKDDSKYVYVALDITLDNTREFGHDWFKVFVLNPIQETEKEYRVDDFNDAYGKCSFGITSKVKHKHQSCEIRIPKDEIDGKKLNYYIRYYGTSGGSGDSPTIQSESYENPTYDTTPTYTGVAQDDDADITSIRYQIQRFNGSSWVAVFAQRDCTIDDGVLNETTEEFTCTMPNGVSLSTEGSHRYNIAMEDAGSNGPNFLKTFTFSTDTDPPEITINAVDDPTSDSTPSVTGEVTDSESNITGVEYQMDETSGDWTSCTSNDGTFNETTEEFTCTVSPALSNDEHTIYIRATDSYDNTSADTDYSDEFTVNAPTPTSSPTPTPRSNSSSANSSSTNSSTGSKPQIPQQTVLLAGGVFTPLDKSSTGNQEIFVITPPRTFIFDAFPSSMSTEPTLMGSLPNPMTGEVQNKTPQNVVIAGDILGIKMRGAILWQVGNIQNIWYRAYGPQYDVNSGAKIIGELQDNPSIIALSFTDEDLKPPGQPKKMFNPKRLVLAHSSDGLKWRILSTSVVDPVNHTVAALDKIGGYYMIVGR